MSLSPTEAVAHLARAAREIAEVWVQAGTTWIPDDVNRRVSAVVELIQPVVPRVDRDYVLAMVRTERNGLVHGPLDRAIHERAVRESAARERDAALERAQYLDHRAAQIRVERAEGERRETEARNRVERAERAALDRAAQEARDVAEHAIQEKLAEEDARAIEEERAKAMQERVRNRPNPAPGPQRYGVSHEGAEHLACAWMRHLGVLDANVTHFSRDGGVDVDSTDFVCQVKNYQGSVPVIEVRALSGVAAAAQKHALILTSGSLTAEAADFAKSVGIAVLQYDAVAGSIRGLNELAVRAIETSLPEAYQLGV